METYNIVRSEGGWGISQNKNKPEGSYATREGAFEVAFRIEALKPHSAASR